MITLQILKDASAFPTYGIPISDSKSSTTLAASTAQSVTVPVGATLALFSYSQGANVFVSTTATAVLPGSSFASSVSELNPELRPVTAGTTISCISDTTAYVQISFYSR